MGHRQKPHYSSLHNYREDETEEQTDHVSLLLCHYTWETHRCWLTCGLTLAASWHHRPMPLLLISRCSPRQSKVPNARQVTLLCSQDWNHGVKCLEFRVWDSGKSLHPSLFPDLYKNIYFSGGFPSCTDGKESDCDAEDLGSIPGSARSPGERNDNQLQYSCLENPTDRGAWRAEVHWVPQRVRDDWATNTSLSQHWYRS